MNDIPTGPEQVIQELENQLDAALFRLAEYEDIGTEAVPLSVIKRMSRGERPIRVWREYRDMSVQDLATAGSTTPEEIALMERGERVDLRIARNVARALKVDVDDLVPWSQD